MYYNTLLKSYTPKRNQSIRIVRYDDLVRRVDVGSFSPNSISKIISSHIDVAEQAEAINPDHVRNYRDEAISRALRTCKELIRINYSSRFKFLTLTYKNPTLNKQKVFSDIKNMCTRFKSKYNYALKYIATLEEHKNYKSFHVHMIIDCDYIDKSVWNNYLWQQGFIDIKTISYKKSLSDCQQTLKYVLKYIHKSADSHDWYDHLYLRSRNWKTHVDKQYYVTKSIDEAVATGIIELGAKNYRIEHFDIEVWTGVFIHVVDIYKKEKEGGG